jgi:hypothetical protein
VSVNKHLPHVLVLPEDDANRQLANGFLLQVDPVRLRRMQVLPVAGGWHQVLESFLEDHVNEMDLYASRFMILLIDSTATTRGWKTQRTESLSAFETESLSWAHVPSRST